jgi:hypothetical protein
MVFNATFNNILVISWPSVLLVEETGVPGENHLPAASHWQTLSHNVVSSKHCPSVSYIKVSTSYIMMMSTFVLYQHTELYFYSACSLKQSTIEKLLCHIDFWANPCLHLLFNAACFIAGKQQIPILLYMILPDRGLIYHPRTEHLNYYTTDVVLLLWLSNSIVILCLMGNILKCWPSWGAIAIAFCLLSANFSNFNLFQRHWTNWNQTWDECKLEGPLYH